MGTPGSLSCFPKEANNVSELVNKQAQNDNLVGTLTLDLPRSEAVGSKAQAMVQVLPWSSALPWVMKKGL